jgi:hypothetical protein
LRGIWRENNACNTIKSGQPFSISRGFLRENNAYNNVQLSRRLSFGSKSNMEPIR